MINNPTISGYKPFYIQKGNNCYDTKTQWGFIAKSNPYPALPSPKDPYKNDWKDENGDDEYTTNLYYEAFEFEVQFYIRTKDTTSGGAVTETAAETIRAKLKDFFDTVKNGDLKVFDSYTALGRQSVRYAGYKEEKFRSRGDSAVCIFTITFKVNDPVTLMKYDTSTSKIIAV